jgi:hypothetical protein
MVGAVNMLTPAPVTGNTRTHALANLTGNSSGPASCGSCIAVKAACKSSDLLI